MASGDGEDCKGDWLVSELNEWGRPETANTYDNHKLSIWRRCAREGFFSTERNLSLHATKAPFLVFGAGVHKSLDVLYIEKNPVKALDALVEFFLENPIGPDKFRTPQRAGEMLAGYWDFWQEDICTLWELIECEHYFEFPLWPEDPSKPWYCGIIDKVRRRVQDAGLGILDHKTSSILTNAKLEAMRLSSQFLGYDFYMKRFSKWREEAFSRSFVDFIQTSQTSKYGVGNRLPLRREPIHTTNAMLDQWLESTRYQISLIEDVYLRQVHERGLDPPMNTDNCERYYSICPFYSLCTQPKDTREMQIQMAYVTRKWDPKERD